MKIISYKKNKEYCFGIMTSSSTFIDIKRILSKSNLLDFIDNFSKYKRIIDNADTSIFKEEKIDSIEVVSPIPNPTSLRDAYAFRKHVQTSRKNRGLDMIKTFDEFPVYYYSNHKSVFGPGTIKVTDDLSEMLDYELEVAVIIGKKGTNITAQEADDYIFGFTMMNDFSSRKIQIDEMKLSLGPAKGKDFATSLGPSILTKDDLYDRTIATVNGNHYDLDLKGFLNGELISKDNLKNMHWTFAQIIERVSKGSYIYPGEVIGSGTCATGCLYELNSKPGSEPYWLQNDDIIAIKAEKIGSLENKIKIV
jgi:fumarylacetoacetate (FAA) hydrolase